MKSFVKTVLAVSALLLCAGTGFAADVKVPATGVKAVVETPAAESKENAKAKAAPTPAPAEAKAAPKAKLVDINSATEAELKAVPGLGAAYAAKIINGRPYANKSQLKSRKVVPPVLYEQVKELLIAKHLQK